ncbi:unnamed protein product [Strongylus vulgaris]|uniref:Protein kinase domain-containing protein n=1 Tax=Strongylus vulgaris TaxID=40348 RepID=A0A3P7JHE6_STRVU|nr:unnamed protein product [Strongylus vulgaris]
MSPENSHALWKEARVMQMYDHPNVVRMYGVANDTEIIYEASLGIEYLHSKGCIHRDIAARNLLMDKVIKVKPIFFETCARSRTLSDSVEGC